MLNLKKAKEVAWIRKKYGSFVTDTEGLANLGDHGSGISKEGGGTPAQCAEYMQSLPIPTSLKRLAPALFKPLSLKLVQDALKRQVPGPSQSIDAFALNIYHEFPKFFYVCMLEIVQHAQEDANLPEAWNKGLIRCIPKTARASTVEKLRFIAVHQLKKNWFMTTLLIQVEHIPRQIAPPPPQQQVGCIKHRQMQHHIWGVRRERDTAESMMLLTIDYRNTFPTLSHIFITTPLTFFSFPPTFMSPVISALRSQYHFVLGSADIREVRFYQEAGIGHGDPFLPQLFSFCATIIIYPLRLLRAKRGTYLYVDHFLIMFGQETTKQQLKQVFQKLPRF